MKREAVKKFIQESKQYLLTATPEQKARYLDLLERAYKNIEQEPKVIIENIEPENQDFLEEK
jgi:hypothetical protein